MRRVILFAAPFLRSLFAVALVAAPVTSGATLASVAVAFAQTADEPAGVSGNPQYGAGLSGPLNTAPPAVCPAWYGAHTACIPTTAGEPERAIAPVFSTLESAEDEPAFAPIEAPRATTSSENPHYGPGWSGPVNTAPAGSCPAWYSAHTTCVPATSGAD